MPTATSPEQTLRCTPTADSAPAEPLAEDLHMSHALRTPLTALKSALDLLCQGELSAESQRFATMAQRNAERMIELVEQLLQESSAKS